MDATKYKMAINKNGVNIIMYANKGKYESTMLYLKGNIYSPEALSPQEENRNLPEENKVQYGNDKKNIGSRS